MTYVHFASFSLKKALSAVNDHSAAYETLNALT